MRCGSRACAALGLALWLSASPIPSVGAEAAAPPSAELQARMTGHFVLDEPRDAVDARLAAVVEQAVAPMSFLIRPIARSRLERVVVACKEYRLALSASEVGVICDARAPIQRKLDNSGGKLTGLDGEEPLDVVVAVAPDSVALSFKSAEGQRTTTYRFDASGGLEIAVQVTSSQIEKPMEWKVRYRRA